MPEAEEGWGDRPQSWPVHGSEVVWDGPAPFSVRTDTISAPARPEEGFDRLVVEHPGAAVILAVDERDRVLVVEQYRHAAGRRFVELPAGLLDKPGEDPLEAAKRELFEEGGVVAGSWTHLLSSYPSPGLSSERIEYFVARDVSEAPDAGSFEAEHEEADMTVSWVPLRDLVAGVVAGRLTNGPLAVAVLAYSTHLTDT